MSKQLIACVACAEMVFEGSCVCPHCGHKYPCRSKLLPTAALLAGLTLSVAGCDKNMEMDYGVSESGMYDETDEDGDGYGTNDDVTGPVDCDDQDASLNWDDDDEDGFSTCDDDCDDADAAVYPNAEETVDDGIDSNCDGEDNT